MRKISTSYLFANLCLLISGLALTFSAYAQTNYPEGNDFPGIAGAPIYTLNQAGDYTFSGTVQTPNDQQDAFKVVIPVGFKVTKAVLQASGGNSQQQPTGFISFADSYPGYSAATFSNSSGVNATRTGDLGPNSESNPYIGLASVDYSVGTSWSIRVTVVSTGGGSTCTNPTLPTITTTRTAICAGTTTTLSIQSGSLNDATNWKWYEGSCGGTPVGTGSSIQVSPGSTTTYYVRGEGGCVTPGACASQQITVSAPFFVSLSNNGPLTCAKQSVLLSTTNAPSGASYTYSNGAVASSASSATATVANSGLYSVTVTVPGGCSATAQTNVTSNTAVPSVSIIPASQTICQGQTASFTAQGADAYRWSTGATTASISANVAGSYSVTGTAGNGCSATATATLTVNEKPLAPSANNVSVCQKSTPVSLVGSVTQGSNLRWYIASTGGTGSSVAPTPPTNTVGSTTYYVSQVNSSGCESDRTPITVTVTPLPNPSIVGLADSYCQGTTAVTLLGSPSGGVFKVDGSTATVFNPASLSVGQHTVVYSYTNSSGCSNTASQNVTINALPVVSITGLASAYCQDATAVPLVPLGSPEGGSFTIDASAATVFNPATLAVGSHTVTYSYTDGNSCTNTVTQNVTVKEVPATPVLVTQAGNSYPAGVSNLTISQNVGSVILSVSGCSGGTINWSGGSATTLAVSTSSQGTQSFTATCTRNGCTSPTTTATVTVVAPTLKVLSRDPDNGQLGNNTIKPYLILQNAGTTPIAYSTITLRYWLTTENNIPLLFQKNYVQIGQGNLNLRYVPLDPARQGATGYIEYSFSAGAGSLAPNGDSGPLEVQANKQDYSSFFQPDDYSYINNSSFTLNPRITAYQNGVIFYGVEPTGTGSSREAAPEAGSLLVVKVLGNPVVGQSAEVEISGVSGQAVQLKLVDLQGKTVHGQSIKEAGSVERVSLPVGNAQGILLLDVSTATQRQQIKLLRP
ncbi:cellulose binding domain-containing protein [Spirosoma oryzicola]|uniref:Ig-like domain-containing protein n=1 Tax=Spirosoma oryzicola TaxID=2898794 RepID=UPI001E5B420E|nr:cellulose binding domain-containing protein [Spirosoma oryzicola]UHG93465.1 hypothetical protein LQ777_11295 [Spirosoma oryzicola]